MKFKILAGITAAVFVLAMNLQYAFSEYGILENSLHNEILAQTTGGTGSGGTGSGGTGTGSDTPPPNGKCLVEDDCTYERKIELGGCPPKFTWETVKGVKKECSKKNCPPNSNCFSTDEVSCRPVNNV